MNRLQCLKKCNHRLKSIRALRIIKYTLFLNYAYVFVGFDPSIVSGDQYSDDAQLLAFNSTFPYVYKTAGGTQLLFLARCSDIYAL